MVCKQLEIQKIAPKNVISYMVYSIRPLTSYKVQKIFEFFRNWRKLFKTILSLSFWRNDAPPLKSRFIFAVNRKLKFVGFMVIEKRFTTTLHNSHWCTYTLRWMNIDIRVVFSHVSLQLFHHWNAITIHKNECIYHNNSIHFSTGDFGQTFFLKQTLQFVTVFLFLFHHKNHIVTTLTKK